MAPTRTTSHRTGASAAGIGSRPWYRRFIGSVSRPGWVLALLPLVFALLVRDRTGLEARLHQTRKNLPEEAAARVEAILSADDFEFDDLLAALPGNKIEGAHLPRRTVRHYVYAGLSVAVF